jgi:DNA-binding NarL/FixJ family response regulator
MENMYPISILIASDHEEDRNNILSMLSGQKDFYIAGIEKDVSGAIIKSERLKPNVLILAASTSGINGPELASMIHRRSPSTAILMAWDKDENEHAARAILAGISAFMLKSEDMNKLVNIVNFVHTGGIYTSASITLLHAKSYLNQKIPQTLERKNNDFFSPIERGIVTHMAQGYSDEEIAKHLNYSAGTIKNSVTAIKRKTKLKNRVQIVIYSLIYGFIALDSSDLRKAKINFDRLFLLDGIQ